jgi:signal transduction histidine kinase/ligand-binding sensor domain-containing protein
MAIVHQPVRPEHVPKCAESSATRALVPYTRGLTALPGDRVPGRKAFRPSFEIPIVFPMRGIAGRCAVLFAMAVVVLGILPSTIRAERLPMRLYTTADGLWSGFINHMMRDSHGFIWFCTRDGLSRFDGYRFTNYKVADGPASQNFSFMFESRRGVFWILLSGKGLYRYDPAATATSAQPSHADVSEDGKVVLNPELVSPRFFAGMFEDRKGNLWIVGSGLFQAEEKEGHVSIREVNLHLPPAWEATFSVHAIAEGEDGSLWLGTTHGLLRRLPDGRVVHYPQRDNPRADYIHFMLADKNGNIWATHPAGVYVLKPELVSALGAWDGFKSQPLTAHPPVGDEELPGRPGEAIDLTGIAAFSGRANRISSLYQQSSGKIWLVDHNRLVLFDGRQFRYFTDARSPFSHLIDDMDGDLWVATLDGVMRFSLHGLVSYGRDDGLKDQEIDAIQEDHAGVLHVVSPGWFVSELKDRKFVSIHPNLPDASRLWTSPLGFLDHTGQWWFLTGRGLYRFPRVDRIEDLARASPLRYTNLDGLPAQWVYCMFEDSRGDLWISVRQTEQGVIGLVRWERSSGTFHRFSEADGLPPLRSAASFAEDRAGNFWFGFYEEGLVRYSGGRFERFSSADGLPDSFITALHVDRAGRLWMTSAAGGLARVDDPAAVHPRFVGYTTREGLSSNNARSLTEDLSGRIYVGTVRGVDRLTPETGTFKHYGSADGLAGDFVITAYCDHTGALWFGTFNGLSRLEPEPEAAQAAPSIRIDGLRIAGVRQPLNELGVAAVAGLELSASQNNLQIDFSSLSMARAPLLRYQYKLQSVDRDWSAPSDQRTVHYATLPPGTYRFLVRAVDPGGLTSVEPASVSFQILSPLWQRWWFLLLSALAVGYAVRALYLYRVAHLLELERIRTRIATDLHDDIGSSLSQIAVLSEVANRQADGTSATSKPLSNIAAISRELVDSMSDIVWSINPRRDHLSDLSQRMRRFASDLFTAHNIEFRFDIQDADHRTRLEADVRRQVFLVFKESVHNIARHSGCKNARVDLRIERHWIDLTVADDGRGFDTTQVSDGHGLMSMRRRAGELGAVLDINSRSNCGTCVSLKAPLGRRRGSSKGKSPPE